MNENETINIVKATAKRLGMTYRQLGEAVGYSEGAIKNAALATEISPSMQKAIELYLENLALKKELEACNTLKSALKTLIQ